MPRRGLDATPRSGPRRWARRILIGVCALLILLAAALGLGFFTLSHRRPVGLPGPEADALARRLERAVAIDAWRGTDKVRWTFRGSTEHEWDRKAGTVRVRFLGRDEEVRLDVGTQQGRAWRQGRELEGPDRARLVKKAYERFINDSFWLNPLGGLFDPGVTRSRVVDEDGESLVIHYASGGVTPGDSYQWLFDDKGMPRAWRLWVKVLPVPGVEISWEDWKRLPSGALVATRHRALGVEVLRLTVDQATDLSPP